MHARFRKLLILLVKVSVTAGLLCWVVSGVHWRDYVQRADGKTFRVVSHGREGLRVAAEEGIRTAEPGQFVAVKGQVVRPGLAETLGRLRLPLYLLAAAILTGQLTLMGVRWWYLMRFQKLTVPLPATIRLMYVGHFFNFFLPGSTGGDVVRAYLATKRTSSRTVAVATVLLDRFAGLSGMALLAGVMTLATWGDPRSRQAAVAVGATVAIILAAGAVLFSRRVGRMLRLDALIDRLPRSGNFRIAIRTLRDLPQDPPATAVVGAITVSVHLLLASGIACMGKALGLPVPIGLYFLFVPVIYILAALPISIGGLGVTEGMYVVFFAQGAQVDISAVVALSLLARFTPMLLSLPGLAFWLAQRGADGPTEGAPAAEPKGEPT